MNKSGNTVSTIRSGIVLIICALTLSMLFHDESLAATNFTVSPATVSLSLTVGQANTSITLSIANTGTATTSFLWTDTLSELTSLNTTSNPINLNAGQTFPWRVTVVPPTTVGTSTGTITIASGGQSIIVPVTLTVTSGGGSSPPTMVSSTTPASGATNVSISSALTATFNEPVNPATVNPSTFTLRDSSLHFITGVITVSGATATFALPSGTFLKSLTRYTATLTRGIQDLDGNALNKTYSWSFTTGSVPDTTPPTVSATSPTSGATNASISSAVTATFSESIDPATVTATAFMLKNSANTSLIGTITTSSSTVTLTLPSGAFLANDTLYTATLTTGIKDLAGNSLATPFVWSFTTSAVSDLTPPTVTSTSPPNGAANVSTSSALTATFSEPVNPATVTAATFTLKDSANTFESGNITTQGATVTFAVPPSNPLTGNTTYTATLTTGIKDLAGNSLTSNVVWLFNTSVAPDTLPPTVTVTSPTNGATNVSMTSALTATFSEPIDPSTVTSSTFTLKDNANNPVTGNITTSGATVTFAIPPSTPLTSNTHYTATLTTGIKDLAGNVLALPYIWSFTTATSASSQTFGLDWSGNGPYPRMLYWHNPFPIYDATYIFKVYPRKKTIPPAQNGYYTTFFWGNDGAFAWDSGGNANTYYGAHPYPIPQPNGAGQWEISVASNDFVTGSEVQWDRWYTQVFRAWRSGGVAHHEFYWDWPDTSKMISHDVTDPNWATRTPPTPAIFMGQAPNVNGASWGGYAGWEELNGIIRGIQLYSGLLSLANIQAEISAPQSTTSGQSLMWYLNLNPTPTDITDKSGRGHNPAWNGTGRPTLYTGP